MPTPDRESSTEEAGREKGVDAEIGIQRVKLDRSMDGRHGQGDTLALLTVLRESVKVASAPLVTTHFSVVFAVRVGALHSAMAVDLSGLPFTLLSLAPLLDTRFEKRLQPTESPP